MLGEHDWLMGFPFSRPSHHFLRGARLPSDIVYYVLRTAAYTSVANTACGLLHIPSERPPARTLGCVLRASGTELK